MGFDTRKLPASLPLNVRIMVLVGLLALTTVVMTTVMIRWTTRRIVEDAIGDQMVMQARIAAHLVAVAETRPGGGLPPAEINRHFEEIVRFGEALELQHLRKRARAKRRPPRQQCVHDTAQTVEIGPLRRRA